MIRIPADWRETYAAILRADPEISRRVADGAWPKLLTYGNAKLEKSAKRGVLTAGVQLSPATESGVKLCFWSTRACELACLGHSAGRMRFTTSKRARMLRSILLLTRPEEFKARLVHELKTLADKADREGLTAACRPNTTSDLPWEKLWSELFARPVHFYDYTKSRTRMTAFLQDNLPANYHLTYSCTGSEASHAFALAMVRAGATAAVVFYPEIPATFNGFPVINGDEHDARMLGEAGCYVGLKAKGAAVKDRSGFVVRLQEESIA